MASIRFEEDGRVTGEGVRIVRGGQEEELPSGADLFALLEEAEEPFALADGKSTCRFLPSGHTPGCEEEERLDLCGIWRMMK